MAETEQPSFAGQAHLLADGRLDQAIRLTLLQACPELGGLWRVRFEQDRNDAEHLTMRIGLSLDRAVRNLMAFAGVSLPAAVAAVTTSPAALLGLDDRGTVSPGAVGDLVVLDPTGHVVATVIGGRVAFDRHTSPPPDTNLRWLEPP